MQRRGCPLARGQPPADSFVAITLYRLFLAALLNKGTLLATTEMCRALTAARKALGWRGRASHPGVPLTKTSCLLCLGARRATSCRPAAPLQQRRWHCPPHCLQYPLNKLFINCRTLSDIFVQAPPSSPCTPLSLDPHDQPCGGQHMPQASLMERPSSTLASG